MGKEDNELSFGQGESVKPLQKGQHLMKNMNERDS